MKYSKIVMFVAVLFVIQVAIGTIVTLVFGESSSADQIIVGYLAGSIASICVFACMSWVYPTDPFRDALIVGISAYVLGIYAAAMIAGEVIWNPIFLIFDIPVLLVAVLVGVSLGVKLHRRGTKT